MKVVFCVIQKEKGTDFLLTRHPKIHSRGPIPAAIVLPLPLLTRIYTIYRQFSSLKQENRENLPKI